MLQLVEEDYVDLIWGVDHGQPGQLADDTSITTLIFRNFYAEIPDEMIEAARIDGAGFFGIYTRIIFPLSISGFVVVIIWQFTQIWNEFLFAVVLAGNDVRPVTVAMFNFISVDSLFVTSKIILRKLATNILSPDRTMYNSDG